MEHKNNEVDKLRKENQYLKDTVKQLNKTLNRMIEQYISKK